MAAIHGIEYAVSELGERVGTESRFLRNKTRAHPTMLLQLDVLLTATAKTHVLTIDSQDPHVIA
jgi:hypothetical protein